MRVLSRMCSLVVRTIPHSVARARVELENTFYREHILLLQEQELSFLFYYSSSSLEPVLVV